MGYRHTQFGWIIITGILAAIVFCVFSINNAGGFQSNELVVPLLLAAILGLFCTLTVEIKEDALSCWFGPGIIRKRVLLSEIEKAARVRSPWYAGWGIRWRPGQYVLWSVSGRDAVELELRNGKRLRIGTDEPEALLEAIRLNKDVFHNQ